MKDKIHTEKKIQNETQESAWVWGLIGNILEEHEYGEAHEIRKGTKQFSGGTKVYLSCGHWGDGYENVNVIGKARNSRRYIQVVMRRKCITNFRMQKVYKPVVLEKMKSENGWGGFWDNSDKSRLEIIKYLDFLNPIKADKERMNIPLYKIMYYDIERYCLDYLLTHFKMNLSTELDKDKTIGELLQPGQLQKFFSHMEKLLNINFYIDDDKLTIEKISLMTLSEYYFEIMRLLDTHESNFGAGWFNPHELSTKKWKAIVYS
ncbi:MAG: hypothetical protein J6X78_04145 [Treponema sp.]|nr:hypothetical protein [Treponema sp.]